MDRDDALQKLAAILQDVKDERENLTGLLAGGLDETALVNRIELIRNFLQGIEGELDMLSEAIEMDGVS